jgi:hypothetical protein
MLLMALRKGGVKCSSACPFYSEEGVVRGVNGVPLKTHCRGTMETVIVDCDVFDPNHIEKLEVSEEQWKQMQQAVRKRAKKVRKPYPTDHEEIHPVGYNWKHRFMTGSSQPCGDKWNAKKSSNVKK